MNSSIKTFKNKLIWCLNFTQTNQIRIASVTIAIAWTEDNSMNMSLKGSESWSSMNKKIIISRVEVDNKKNQSSSMNRK